MKVQSRTPKTRRGFTLIELVVVLLVLAGLAGMLVPVLQNMVQKTHGATGGANMNEVAKAIQLYEAQTMGRHPDGYDSLHDGTALIAGAEHLSLIALNDGDLEGKKALNKIGITTLMTNSSADTFAAPGDPIVLDDDSSVATLLSGGVTALQLPTTTGRYVAFGIGAQNTAIGKTMVAAPVHFPESGESPTNQYSRFVAIYEIPADGPARLATIAAFHDGEELVSLGNHLEEFYETQQL